jgi:RNA polymerase sigma-70 factor (ECF subfamily)
MSPEIESLLRDEGWVRALARRLVRDASEADDLVQEAWLAARRGPAEAAVAPKRWLAAVLRNEARQRARGDARRARRERSAARGEATPSASELLERLEVRERVVRAVRELDEPYRTAILLRWFEGLAPREIARRRGVPRRTVHSWLARGLEQLRARLRRELGSEKGAWLLALLPLCAPPGAPAGAVPEIPWIGAAAMTANVKLALLGLAAAGAAAAWIVVARRAEPARVEPQAAFAAPRVEPVAELRIDGAAPAAAPAPAREALAVAVQPEPPATESATLARTIAGRAVDLDDRPLAGLAVGLRADGALVAEARTAGDGSFELAAEALHGELVLLDEAWTPVLRPLLWRAEEEVLVLVAAPRIELAGHVLDVDRRPAEGARLRIDFDEGLRARFGAVLDHSQLVEPSDRADADGGFALPQVPRTDLARLRIDLPGYETRFVPLPEASDWAMEIVLDELYEGVLVLRGRVVDEEGAAVAGAWISLDGSTAETAPDGTFALDLDGPGESGVLQAAAAGRRPARIERTGETNLDPAAWPRPLELVLTGAPAAIRGRVVDAAGAPVPDAKLRLVDPTPFGSLPVPGMNADIVIGTDLESLLDGRRFSYGDRSADDEGRFALTGLDARAYVVEAIDRRTLAWTSATLAASADGEEVELRLPDVGPTRPVAGRVVHPDGSPAAGARVLLEARRAEQNESEWIEGAEAVADEEGRFAFATGGAAATHLWLDGPEPGSGLYVELAGLDLEDLEVVLPRTCHVQVVLTDPAEADAVRFLDAEGATLNPVRFHGNLAWGQERLDLSEGRSEAVLVSELAAWLVLEREEAEVRRVPLALAHGELNTVRP